VSPKKFAEILFPQGSEPHPDAVSTGNRPSRSLDAADTPTWGRLSTSPVETRLSVSEDPGHAYAMSHIDGCRDACGNTELPYRVEETSDGFRAYYGCEDCGQFWNTSWKD
jgi:hypothetical protein